MTLHTHHDIRYEDVESTFFPVLAKMEFDTKERYKFFCCARQRACAIGSGPRHAHSALRFCTPHVSRADLTEKVQAAAAGDDLAAQSLSRRGIHPHRQCTALLGRKHCVIPWNGRRYFGLFTFDIMHCLFINCIGYLLDALLDSMTPTVKATLDKRAKSLAPFRNPINGLTTPRVTRLSSSAYLTAENKVTHLFVLSHALGSKALLLRPEIRHDAMVAISSLQTICYSVRGLRPFTRSEYNYIFNHVGKLFFHSLSRIQHRKRLQQIATAEAYNVDKPPAKRQSSTEQSNSSRVTHGTPPLRR